MAEGAVRPLSGEALSGQTAAKTGKPVLEIENLSVQFRSSHGLVRAVENIGYTVHPGEMVAIVGESGSGKSVSALTIMRLLAQTAEITSGSIVFDGTLDALEAGTARVRVDALNQALEGIPEEKVRYHLCWGSWNGPHTDDLPLVHIVDLMLMVKAQGYSVEAGNVRHEHEWKVWRDVKLPDGKILIPGVVSHKTQVVEHPELVADRLVTYAKLVGRENVQGGTDCGMGLGRVHHEIGWAKLQALVEGAQLASKQLW